MDTQVLKRIAIDGSAKYYDYLEKYSKGLEKISVNKIEFIDSFVCLYTNSGVAYPDKVEIEICGTVYDRNDIRIIEFDREENTVLVLPKINLKAIFYQVEAKDIKVVSDLRFTVKNITEWYSNLKTPLLLPEAAPDTDFEPEFGANLSEYQKRTVKGVLENPFTFIWGVRGTAKTFAVFADCVMNYVRNGKKIIITAPTDEAVDRNLSCILEMLKRENISLRKVLRLGLPSKKFARRYKEVCELSGIDKMVNGMESRIRDLEDAYEYFVYRQSYNLMKEEIPKMFTRLAEIYLYKKEVRSTLDAVNEEWDKLVLKLDKLKDELKKLNMGLDETCYNITAYGSKKIRIFVKNKLEEAEKQKEELQKAIKQRNRQIEELQYDINILSIRKNQLQKAYESDKRDLKCIEEIKCLLEFDIEILNLVRDINEENYLDCKETLVKLVANYDTLMRQRGSKYSMYKDMKSEEILTKINTMTQEKSNLIKESTIERAKDVLIVAASIDTYIGKIATDNDLLAADAKHIFMDEAGNCPAVKGLTLLKKGIPVTLIADASQRELTCEMPYNEIVEPGNQAVSLWGQSVLHLEELVGRGFDDFLNSYMKDRSAPYKDLIVFSYESDSEDKNKIEK